MALQQLDEEQIRTWTLEQKDRWWRDNVFRGNMPQLTIRAAVTGMMIGGLLSLTNLYVGAKTGWTLGIGITSVILAFGMFKVLSSLGLASEFTVLENNCMQSIATAAGYMTGPLTSSLTAYMLVADKMVPMVIATTWIVSLSVLGVLFAFPLKRRYINDEQHPFPEGRAAGVVMDSLHSGDASEGLLKARLLAIFGTIAAVLSFMSSEKIMEKLHLARIAIPKYLDDWLYRFCHPSIWGTELRQLSVQLESDIVMAATGGLMGIRTGVSLMVGAIINYCVLAPWMIARGDIQPKGFLNGVPQYGFSTITMWALWGGVAMMTTASLYAFFAKPKVVFGGLAMLFRRKRNNGGSDVLKDVELPMWVFAVGIPLIGGLVVFQANWFFDVKIWHGIVAIPLIFVFTMIAVNSTALTSITPVGAVGKLTQLTYSVLAPGSKTTNIATASISAEAAGNAANLLMDIKPGYMLGAKPRQQAIGHVLGIFAGSLVAVPVFYLIFLREGPQNLISEKFSFPSVTVWKAVADMLAEGLSKLPHSAQGAAVVGALLGIAVEAVRVATKGRFWLSGVGVGLACVISFDTCLAMFLGALFFWLAERLCRNPNSRAYKILVKNQEPVCAGVIAGGALMGIAVKVVETLLQ